MPCLVQGTPVRGIITAANKYKTNNQKGHTHPPLEEPQRSCTEAPIKMRCTVWQLSYVTTWGA